MMALLAMWYRAVPLTVVWYHPVPMSRVKPHADEAAVRDRILNAAFEAFQAQGYAATSTLEIATRARVSRRELYALVGNKQKMLIAAIGERAKRLQAPADMPTLRVRATLAQVPTAFGIQLMREVSPLSWRSSGWPSPRQSRRPKVARTLDCVGSETSRAALRHTMTQARAAALVGG